MAVTTRGVCKYCGKEFARTGIVKHLDACGERKIALVTEPGEKACKYYELVISDKYEPDFWLVVDAKDTSLLSDLDMFLRDIWVECCGHMSEFRVGTHTYADTFAMEMGRGGPSTLESMFGTWRRGPEKPRDWDVKLKTVFKNTRKITYMYDMGTPTELVIQMHGSHTGKCTGDEITILSRNIPPKTLCSVCGQKDATWVNAERIWNDPEHAFICDDCKKEIFPEVEAELGYDPFLPNCNSPRRGVCAYKGSENYADVFVPDKNPL